MARPGNDASSSKRPAGPSPFSRWLTVVFLVIIGLILWVGVLSNSSGQLTMPGADSLLYVAAVIGAVALLARADSKRKNRSRDEKGEQ
jgi:hypothetical protein